MKKITKAEQIVYDVEQNEIAMLEEQYNIFWNGIETTITRKHLHIAEIALRIDNKQTNQKGKIVYPKRIK